MIINLTYDQIMLAVQMGSRRNVTAKKKGFMPAIGMGWDIHIEGALSEVAAAKALNLWLDPSIGKQREEDLIGWNIRSTRYESGELRIEDYETDGKFLLMIGSFDIWRVAGWCTAEDARSIGEFKVKKQGRTPAWWVPQEKLRKYEN